MYENLPLHDLNVKLWIFLGYLEPRNRCRMYFWVALPALTFVGQVLNIINKWQHLEDQILSLFMATIFLNTLMRVAIVHRNEHKFIKFMKNIEQWHLEAERCNDYYFLGLLEKIAKRTHLLTRTSLLVSSFGAITTVIMPLIQSDRLLMFDIYVPGIDVNKSPLREVIYFTQFSNVLPFIMSTYIPFTNLFLSWVLFGIGLLQNLCHRLRNINAKSEWEQLQQLRQCVIYHERIINFGRDLEELVSFVTLLEFLFLSLMLCVLLFFIVITGGAVMQFITASYIGFIFYVMFLSYWHANEFSFESLKVAETIYDLDWINSSTEFRKSLLIILARSQNALQITAGGLYPMTLQTFQKLLNASYTYFALLRSLIAK